MWCRADAEGLTPCHAIALNGEIPKNDYNNKNDNNNNSRSSSNNSNNSSNNNSNNSSNISGNNAAEKESDVAASCTCSECLHRLVPHCGARNRRRCLEYLVQYGGDLKKLTYEMRETTKDIAVRRGKSSIVAMIEEYCECKFVEESFGNLS